MKLTDQEKKDVVQAFIKIISNISDKEYQKRAWIQGKEADFDENVCLFFDIGDPILKNYKDYGITESQYKILVKFREKFEVFSDENDLPEEFIDSTEWQEIMDEAKKVLKAFNYKGTTPL